MGKKKSKKHAGAPPPAGGIQYMYLRNNGGHEGRLWSKFFVATMGFMLVAGCATTPRTLEEDQAIKSVAIVTALSEPMSVSKTGTTVFNNDRSQYMPAFSINQLVADIVTKRVRAARPEWIIKPSGADSIALASKARNAPFSLVQDREDFLQADLVAMAKRLDVDALVVVKDSRFRDTATWGPSLSLTAKLFFEPSFGLAPGIVIRVLDRNGETLAVRGFSEGRGLAAKDLGITDQLASMNAPGVPARIDAFVKEALEFKMGEAMTAIGY